MVREPVPAAGPQRAGVRTRLNLALPAHGAVVLRVAYGDVCNLELLPMRQADECSARKSPTALRPSRWTSMKLRSASGDGSSPGSQR